MAVAMISRWSGSYYQDELWQVVGARTNERVRLDIQAVLLAQIDNAYDKNAISVWINGMKVGHLSRDDAVAYRPGLLALQARTGKPRPRRPRCEARCAPV
jgi:hypothetical protein